MPTPNAAGLVRAKHQNKQKLQQQDDADHQDGPPYKKRRYARKSPGNFLENAEAQPGRPPARLSITDPHAVAQQTTNGVRNNLPIEDGNGSGRTLKIAKREDEIQAVEGSKESPDSEKRVLRSQDPGSRGGSELALFFPDFYDILYGAEKEPDLLDANSVLYLTESNAEPPAQHKLPFRPRKTSDPQATAGERSLTAIAPSASTARLERQTPVLPSYQTLDLSQYEAGALQFEKDPLPDSEYLVAHRRGERWEKQLRNVEKERARHEKSQLDVLLEELLGPDWNKTMGLPGLTDTDKKAYEGKRQHFIRKVKELLTKFDDWKEREKDLRLRRERAAARAARQEEDGGDSDEADEDEDEDEEDEEEAEADEQGNSDEDNPSSGSIDSTALQLQRGAGLEPRKAIKIKLRLTRTVRKEVVVDDKPFTSFFAKSHERAGALARHRRGRHILAFGQPLPDMPEQQTFEPPESIFEQKKEDQHRKSERRKS